MPTWYDLLKEFSSTLHLSKKFGYYYSKCQGNLPSLTTSLAEEFHEIWWTLDDFDASREEYKNHPLKAVDIPFKIELSKFIAGRTTGRLLEEEISLLKKVVIDGIITTNWDLFLESTFKDFKSYIGQNQLLFSQSVPIGEIYKIHGCITLPDSLVATKEDYDYFQKRNAYLAAKLLTIFIEHPIIFLGYSISDPNISDILVSLNECLDDNNVEKLKNRLIFVEWDKNQIEPFFTDGILRLPNNQSIPIKHIKINSFIPLYEVLSSLRQRLPVKILRRFKDSVYEFIKTNEPTDKIYVGDLNSNEEATDVEFVIGVGVANTFAKQGLLGIGIEDIIEDVLFNNRHIPVEEFINTALPKLLRGRVSIPLYKYFRALELIDDRGLLKKKNSSNSNINNYFQDKKEDFYFPAPCYAKKKNNIRTQYKALTDLLNDDDIDDVHCFYYIPLLEREKIDLKVLREYLVGCYKRNYIKNTYFKKLVCYYDYLKYGVNI